VTHFNWAMVYTIMVHKCYPALLVLMHNFIIWELLFWHCFL